MNGEEGQQAGARRTLRQKIADNLRILPITFAVSLAANVVFGISLWSATRDRVEITCSLEGWIPFGGIEEAELEELKITYDEQPVNNVLLVSWRVANTGNKGIERFEIPPSITYPKGLTVMKAFVSEKAKMLDVDKRANIDPEKGVIKLNNMGILNEDDSFKLDVLMVNPNFVQIVRI